MFSPVRAAPTNPPTSRSSPIPRTIISSCLLSSDSIPIDRYDPIPRNPAILPRQMLLWAFFWGLIPKAPMTGIVVQHLTWLAISSGRGSAPSGHASGDRLDRHPVVGMAVPDQTRQRTRGGGRKEEGTGARRRQVPWRPWARACLRHDPSPAKSTCKMQNTRGTQPWLAHALDDRTLQSIPIAHHAKSRSRCRITQLAASLSPHRLLHLSHCHTRWLRLGRDPWGGSRRRHLTRLAFNYRDASRRVLLEQVRACG